MELVKKFIGAMVSHALGDALGAPFEKKKTHAIREEEIINNDKTYRYTDDTIMMLIIARSIVKNKKYCSKDVANEYLKHYIAGTLRRIGSTTRCALEKLKRTGDPHTSGVISKNAASNGVAMRITPIALFLSNSSNDILYETIRMEGYITHRNELAISGAFAVALMIKKALYEKSKEKIVDYTLDVLSEFGIENKVYEAIERALKLYYNEIEYFKAIKTLGNTGYIIHTVSLVTFVFLMRNTVYDTIISLIRAGGDTDTNAAIGGAISGAFYGTEEKIMNLVRNLESVQEIINLAKQIYYLVSAKKCEGQNIILCARISNQNY